ncbi:MAG: DUF1552 domain-containing protein [Polyangiales bacterium]
MIRRSMSRRRYLRGVGGALLALPTLEFMLPARAAAQTPLEKKPRLLVFYLPNGRRPEWWVPAATGFGLVFPGESAPLQPYAARALSIVDLDNSAARNSPGAAHAMGTGTVMTGTAIPDLVGIKNNVSLDQRLVELMAPSTRFKSLQWSAGEPGPCDVGGASCAYTQSISWTGPGRPLVPTIDPAAAFKRVFGGGADGLAGAAGETRKRSAVSVLDAVRTDAKSLQTIVGSADRRTLDGYFTALRELELSLSSVDASCEVPTDGPAGGLAYPDRVSAFFKLIQLVFQCDQTRFLSFMMEFGLSCRSHDFLSASGTHHGLSHYGSDDQKERLRKVEQWHSLQLAALLDLLATTPGAAGNMLLDETLVLVIPSMGAGSNHDHARNCPLLIGGKNFIQTNNRQVAGNTELANLHVSLLHAYGYNETFGDAGTAPIPGVLV